MSDPAASRSLLPSIRQYLVSRIVGIVLFSFVVFSLAAWLIVVRPAQDELAQAEITRAANEVEGDIRALIGQIERVVQTTQQMGRSGLLRISSPQEFAVHAIPFLSARQQISSILLADERGQALQLGRDARGGWLLRETDAEKLRGRQHWIHLNEEGGYVSEEWVNVDFDARTRPWFQGAAGLSKDDAIHWTEPYLFFEKKEPGLTASMRWTDRNAGVRQVIAIDLLLLDLSHFTTKVAVGDHGQAAILTADARLLGVPRSTRVHSDDDIKQRIMKSAAEADLPRLAGAHAQWLADGKPAARPSFYRSGGETWIGRFQSFKLGNQELLVATLAPRSDFAFGSLWDALAIGVMMLMILVLAYLVGRRFSRRFAGVIDSLIVESERIGALQLDAPVRIEPGTREIGKLVSAQERMRVMLLDATRGLEEKVAARTSELAERETFTRALMDSSTAGLVLSTPDGEVRHVSLRWSELVGYTLEEARAMPSGELYADPDARGRFLEAMQREGSVRNFEARFRRKSGGDFWGLLNSSYVEIGGERLIASWVQDISEQRAAAERVTAARAQLQALMDGIPSPIFMKDLQGRYLRVNQPFARFAGKEISQIIGRSDRELFPKFATAYESADREVYAAGRTLHTEDHAFGADGVARQFLTSKFLLHDADGKPYALAGVATDISERKAAEAALAEREAYFRTIFENSGSGIVSRSRDGSIFRANKRYLEFTGYTEEELRKIETPALMHPDDRAAARASLERLRNGEIPSFRAERRYFRKDGSMRWADVAVSAILDTSDNYLGSVTVVNDMTDRKSMEEALHSANAEQSAIFESATSGIALIKDRMVQRCNRKLEEIFGYVPGEFLGKPTRIWYASEEEYALGGAGVYEQLSRGDTHRREQELVRKDGSRFWCRLTGRAVDTADAAKGTVWMLEDVTEERAAADVLRTANERLDLAQQAGNVGVFDVVVGGRNFWTPQLQRLFGMEPGTFGGTVEDWAALLHPDDRERALRGFNAALASDRSTFTDEFRMVRPDGEVRWFQSICRIMRAPDGKALRAVGVNIDATELITARTTAMDATQAKSMFLASMSHEIRTPMNGVLGLLQLLAFTSLDAEQKATLDGAHQSARSLLRIIDDLLDFSKIEAGKLEIRPEVTSVASVIESVRQVYSGVASAKDLSLLASLDPGISPALKVDPLRLRQILNNFVSNAVKFTAQGSVEITARRMERASDRETVRFAVTDTGIGISKEAQARLFQPFVQATGDTAQQFGGTGLGLTICLRLAEMMGGRIEMQSEPGKGTTMALTLALPVADPRELPKAGTAGEAAAAMVASRRRAPTVEDARAEGTLVLIAEDHPTNRNIAVRLLNLLGYAAETAEDGQKALAKWDAGRYALVLTDCNMPMMDGYDLARAIRKHEAGAKRRVPIIACTANALAGDVERCLEAGMDDFVAKPIELQTLAQAIERWLPLPATGKRAAPPAAPAGRGNGAPLDRSSLAAISGGDAAMEREILAEFKAANDADMAALRSALAARDIAKVTSASHRVKGACKMVGATALADVCERMEKAGRCNNWQDVAVEQAALEREMERLNTWLNAY